MPRINTRAITAEATAPETDIIDVPAERVTAAIAARRSRSHYLPGDLFADPASDMMLGLLEAEISIRPVSVSSLCIASAVPATTALRWIKTLTKKGLFIRRADPSDGRRVFIELSTQASLALRRYFSSTSGKANA